MALPSVLVLMSSNPPQYAREGQLIVQSLEHAGFAVQATTDPAILSQLADGAQKVVVLYTFGDYLTEAQIESLARFVSDGGGLVGIHTALATNPANETLGRLLGARIEAGEIVEHTLAVSDADHPIAKGIAPFTLDDEFYRTTAKSVYRTFLTTAWKGKIYPMGWTRNEGNGKVAYLGNGHTPAAFLHPTFQTLLARCVRFVAGERV